MKGAADSGEWSGGKFSAITIGPGAFAANVNSVGPIGLITVKNGALNGQLTASSFGAIGVTSGSFNGSIASTTPASALGSIPAVARLTIVGGNLAGDVSLFGALGVKANGLGSGGSISGSVVNAAKIASISVAKDLGNSLILAGANLGADRTLGGTGANTDSFAAGSIGAISIGSVTTSTIAAGLKTTNTPSKTATTTILGGTADAMASLIVRGSADPASYFAAGKFTTKPKSPDVVVDAAD